MILMLGNYLNLGYYQTIAYSMPWVMAALKMRRGFDYRNKKSR